MRKNMLERAEENKSLKQELCFEQKQLWEQRQGMENKKDAL